MTDKTNNRDMSLDLYRQLNQKKLLHKFVTFNTIKHLHKKYVNKYVNHKNPCKPGRDTDPTGGFLHRSKLQETAKTVASMMAVLSMNDCVIS